MKRSEMIRLIERVLADVRMESSESRANRVLTTIENAGMLPPIEPDRTVSDLDLGAPEWEQE